MSVRNYPFDVASGDNRINSAGRAIGSIKGRTSLFVTNVVAAGAILAVPAAGTQFYVTFSTAELFIRPTGGVFNSYQQGTGLQLTAEENAFDLIEIENRTAFPVIFQIFAGFDEYIDNRVILATSSTVLVANPVLTVPGAATQVLIPDLSGQPFTDINGGKWYGVSRVTIIVSNNSATKTYVLQKYNSLVANGPGVALCFPQTSLRYDASGNYTIDDGGTSIDAVISEIYNAVPRA